MESRQTTRSIRWGIVILSAACFVFAMADTGCVRAQEPSLSKETKKEPQAPCLAELRDAEERLKEMDNRRAKLLKEAESPTRTRSIEQIRQEFEAIAKESDKQRKRVDEVKRAKNPTFRFHSPIAGGTQAADLVRLSPFVLPGGRPSDGNDGRLPASGRREYHAG